MIDVGVDNKTLFETCETKNHLKPSEVQSVQWIYVKHGRDPDSQILGKWLVFKHYDEIDDTWEKIRTAILTDNLQGCTDAKCSTMRYNPSGGGPGPSTSAVICVYTCEHNMDDIGFKLIELVQQDIKYKTDEDTLNYNYAFVGGKKVTIKTIYWNNGKPSFECEGSLCCGQRRDKEDMWHVNVVNAPEPFSSEEVHGRWILSLDYDELTGLWHFLKDKIESKEKNFGAIRMLCPPKLNYKSSREKPVFLIFTSKKDKDVAGKYLIKIVEDDIHYEHKSLLHGKPHFETLYWNKGEPAYEKITRKGITKNWRTGEDIS